MLTAICISRVNFAFVSQSRSASEVQAVLMIQEHTPFQTLLTSACWGAGRVHAKRIKSFLRYLVTQNDGPEVLLLSDNSTLDARHQSAVHDYPSVVPLSEPLVGSAKPVASHRQPLGLNVLNSTAYRACERVGESLGSTSCEACPVD